MADFIFQSNDIIFVNVMVIDGSGLKERFLANVIVRDEKIFLIDTKNDKEYWKNKVQQQDPLSNKIRLIDGENGKWCLCPGFIDMHAHSDLSLLHTPSHHAKITQGVTTEVIGQDGIGYSPVNDWCLERIRVQIAGWNGNPKEPKDFFSRWRTVKEYLDVLDENRIATNVAYLVPQGNVRMLAMGYEKGKPNEEQLQMMKEQLQISLDQGAIGMSSGLTYVPGMYADDEELGQLLDIVQKSGGYYCPHTRSYGKGAMEAYEEMIELAKKTGCRLHLTHATLNFGQNAARAQELMDLIDSAIQQGIEISLDTYPYLPGSTTLAALLPSWAAASDDLEKTLTDPIMLEKVKFQSLTTGTDGCHGCRLEWETIEIAGVQNPTLQSCVGKTIEGIAKERNKEPFEIFIELLIKDNQSTLILQHVGHEENVRRIMRHPNHCGGSDGILTASKPHPRGWGTFTRYLGHYSRDLEQGRSRMITKPASVKHEEEEDAYEKVEPCTIFSGGLEETIAHLTSRAANVIGISQSRGSVNVGLQADLCLFDPQTVSDKATFANPTQASRGIRTVLVNGKFALDEGIPTGIRAGQTIRRRFQSNNGKTFVR